MLDFCELNHCYMLIHIVSKAFFLFFNPFLPFHLAVWVMAIYEL